MWLVYVFATIAGYVLALKVPVPYDLVVSVILAIFFITKWLVSIFHPSNLLAATHTNKMTVSVFPAVILGQCIGYALKYELTQKSLMWLFLP